MPVFEYAARLVGVVDGDTIDVEVDLGFYLHQEMRLRLRGVNTPEIRGPQRPDGLVARAFVENTLGKATIAIAIRTFKIEKYGRFLADVYYGPIGTPPQELFSTGTLLNEELVSLGLAVVSPE